MRRYRKKADGQLNRGWFHRSMMINGRKYVDKRRNDKGRRPGSKNKRQLVFCPNCGQGVRVAIREGKADRRARRTRNRASADGALLSPVCC